MSDIVYMQRAIDLATLGLNTTTPNPRVGCVLVKDGDLVGEGYHQRAGEAHAEVNALKAAGANAKGATAYVSLEPCSHQGRTGPCADALIQAGITTVVYGMLDPNPEVAGRGLDKLRAAGVEVKGPVLADQAEALNPGFIKRMRQQMPWVRVKIGASLDGRTAMANGESQWITSQQARQDVQRLRARSCAIVTGVETVLSDNPALTVRDPALGDAPRQPLRVIVDSKLRTPADAQILEGAATAIASCSASEAFPAPVWALPTDSGRVDLKALLHKLAEQQCNEVLVEAGATLAGAFVQAGLVDELVVYLAPKLLGSDARAMLQMPIETLAEASDWEYSEVVAIGSDLRLTLTPKSD